MQVLDDLYRLSLVKAGTGLELPSSKRRTVRLELNTAGPCQLRLQTGPKDIRFLANVDGRDTLSFVADGPVTVWPDAGDDEVWLWCSEMDTTHVVFPDAAIFTKIANRKARNPELERIAQKMQENADRRFAHFAAEVAGALRAATAENETLKAEVKRGRKRKNADTAAPGGTPEDDAGAPGAEPAPTGDVGGDDGGE